jgi:hypothetical protein
MRIGLQTPSWLAKSSMFFAAKSTGTRGADSLGAVGLDFLPEVAGDLPEICSVPVSAFPLSLT